MGNTEFYLSAQCLRNTPQTNPPSSKCNSSCAPPHPHTHIHGIPSIKSKRRERNHLRNWLWNYKAPITGKNTEVPFLIRSLDTCLESNSPGSPEILRKYGEKMEEDRASQQGFSLEIPLLMAEFIGAPSLIHSYPSQGDQSECHVPLFLSYSPIWRDVGGCKVVHS